ncbi:unnamed protein product [Scytosiphon promiscuus]
MFSRTSCLLPWCPGSNPNFSVESVVESFGDVVYTLETLEVFKAEEPGPNEYDEVGATFEMTTGGSTASCGVYMRVDGSTEYVLDMKRYKCGGNPSGVHMSFLPRLCEVRRRYLSDDYGMHDLAPSPTPRASQSARLVCCGSDGKLYAAGLCGLCQEWDEADRAEFEAGCDNYDPCDGTCSESQECLRSSGSYSEIEYYCSDTCDPNPCPEGTACTLDHPPCDDDFCVAEAVCGGGTIVSERAR